MSSLPNNALYHIPFMNALGEIVTLEPFYDELLLIVNTASKCGFARQFSELEQLHKTYASQGLNVLGFPCDQFFQEPLDDSEMLSSCALNFGVSFPLYAKIHVNGPKTHPLFNYLKVHAKGLFGTQSVKWNFTKFLITPQGQRIERFAPITTPKHLEYRIQQQLPIR